MFNFLSKERIQLLVIALLIILAYSNIFQNGYQGDDYNVIFNWDFVHHISNIPKILTQNVFEPPFFRFRPLGTSLIAIYYHFFGANLVGYHIHSIVAHIIKTVLVYLIAAQLVHGSWFMVHREKRAKPNELLTINYLPFITALIFGLHPVQTESVTHVVVSLDGTGYIFFLASFWSYLHANSTRISTPFDGIQGKRMYANRWYWVSVILAFLAFFSYELTITLPLVIVFYDFCFRTGPVSRFLPSFTKVSAVDKSLADRSAGKPASKSSAAVPLESGVSRRSGVGNPSTTATRSTLSLVHYAPFFIAAFFYLSVRLLVLHKLSGAQYLADSFYLTMLVMSRVFVTYLGLLAAPVYLSINHSVLPGVMSWLDPFTNLAAIKSQSIFQPQILKTDPCQLVVATTVAQKVFGSSC